MSASYFERRQAKEELDEDEHRRWLARENQEREEEGEFALAIYMFLAGVACLAIIAPNLVAGAPVSITFLPVPLGLIASAVLRKRRPLMSAVALIAALVLPIVLAALLVW